MFSSPETRASGEVVPSLGQSGQGEDPVGLSQTPTSLPAGKRAPAGPDQQTQRRLEEQDRR